MQPRMQKFPLSMDEMKTLLSEELVGRLTTLCDDGYPYTAPVHFLYYENAIYLHGRSQGQKLDHINRNPKVCFEIDRLDALLTSSIPTPCKADTAYQSVIITGDAQIVDSYSLKREILCRLAVKYIEHMPEAPIPDAAVKNTGIIRITIRTMTGKYHSA